MNDLRKKFIEFFKEKGHLVLPSASLVPLETDPTVLFNTAGMQQFKNYYANPTEAPNSKITTCQKCVRTGDIDEVGDKTHCTFFEMLGNFSFGYPKNEGSYFKKEAIFLAWEFLTEVLKIEKSRIHATYFVGERGVPKDDESLKILESIDGLSKVVPQGFDDNFWSLGTENSPGGPTVEFYIDDVEIWNLVFNEYIFKAGKFEPSEQQGVDTGMGLERLLCYAGEPLDSVYHTELFAKAHSKLHELLQKEDVPAERIILDHIRAAVFIINDGVVPANKDKGYVLRRLIRRAIVKGQQIGITQNFTSILAKEYFETYQGVYEFNSDLVVAELNKEEEKFRKTLKDGLKILESFRNIDGKNLFNLYQSFGIPLEISLEELSQRGIKINNETIEQFNNMVLGHQELSRTASAGMFKGGLAEAGEETTKYHTATHLMLAALREVLGDEVFQKGSNITAERIRFDFSYPEKLTSDQIEKVERIVNEKIQEDLPVEMTEMTLEEAKKSGAMGVFESKYGDKVRVYTIGSTAQGGEPFSREICGGPHVARTGDLGEFKIQKEESSSAGIRRIKAILK